MSAITELQTRLNRMKENGLSDIRFHLGEVSDCTVEEFCAEVLLALDAIEKKRELEYLTEHYELTEMYIGIVQMQLNRESSETARESLKTLIKKLERLTIKYHPLSERMMELNKKLIKVTVHTEYREE